MRIFISYARIDKTYCKQIIDLLDIHEIWYDRRLHAGQKWWEEILSRLGWCEAFVFLISPDSVASEYCQRELSIAQSLGKYIIPVLIHQRATIPESLRHIQYVDLSGGLDTKGIKDFLTAIFIAERQLPVRERVAHTTREMAAMAVAPGTGMQDISLIDEAAAAMETSNFDRAVFLLKSVKESGFASRFIDLNQLLKEAEAALERQAYLREAEREYTAILALIRRERTRQVGCDAFRAFQKDFPDYDPENLDTFCKNLLAAKSIAHLNGIPVLEWCSIPGGKIVIDFDKKTNVYNVGGFLMSKYPITNAQYQHFLDAEDGYKQEQWWKDIAGGLEWRRRNPEPQKPRVEGHLYPRSNVTWYEAYAFCNWLSHRTGANIKLPTELQWQRAAQGDDGRAYPWGHKFNKAYCNSNESGLRRITPVIQYPQGVSPFGVVDMAGNVWEWCLHDASLAKQVNGDQARTRVPIRGGSCISSPDRCLVTFRFYIDPACRYTSIGFRVVCETPSGNM